MSKRRLRRTDLRPSDRQLSIVDRILDSPDLTAAIPRLPPELLHRIIQHAGLEACGALLVRASPNQLRRVFDEDLWDRDAARLGDRFDPDRFAKWLEALLEAGSSAAASSLAALDHELLVAGFAAHVRVFDGATFEPTAESDFSGTERLDRLESCEIGGYVVAPRRTATSTIVFDALRALDEHAPDAFHRTMRGCRRLSNSIPEVDGLDQLLDDREQAMFDLGVDRDIRRENKGFIATSQARAFLQAARHGAAAARTATADPLKHVSQRRSARLQPSGGPRPQIARSAKASRSNELDSALAREYFQDRAAPPVSQSADTDGTPRDGEVSRTAMRSDPALAALVNVLQAESVAPAPHRARLTAGFERAPRFPLLQSYLASVGDDFPRAHSTRCEELAFLANTLAAGSSVLDRPLTPLEASDAAAAVCNLGLENLPSRDARLSPLFLADHSLVAVFQVGWNVLYENVCMAAAGRLIGILRNLRCLDPHIESDITQLRKEMRRWWREGTPWRARHALEAIAALDLPAWTALTALVDEFPVMHAAIEGALDAGHRSIDASGFSFIAENNQIAAIGRYLDTLPRALAP